MIRLSCSNITTSEIEAVTRVMSQGFLGMGQEVQKFEKELAAYLGGGSSVACVNTGTASLHLACQAIGLKQGDEVLVPSLTFVASFQAVSATGATPIACDIDGLTGLLDLVDAKNRITSNTKAIMFVHYASNSGNLDELYRFARENNLRVIEDAAHAFGCKYKGKKIGTFGDVICFSFDGIKNITSGEGGAVVSCDSDVISRVSDLRLLGVQKDTEKRYSGTRSWEFDVIDQGWRYHMSDIMAAIGRIQLERLEAEFVPKRMKLVRMYREQLKEIKGIECFEFNQGADDRVVPHIFPVKILNHKKELIRKYLADKGIQVGVHYQPNHLLSKYAQPDVNLPVVEKVYSQILTLPLHTLMEEQDVAYIVNCLKESI